MSSKLCPPPVLMSRSTSFTPAINRTAPVLLKNVAFMIGVWPLPTAVPLVHQNPRDVQQLEEHGNSVVVTGLVQSCAVEVVFVVVYMFYYCNHQAGPLVTSTPGVGVSSSRKKFPQLLQLAKIALLPQVVLLGRHGFVGDSLQNKQQGILWSYPNPG